MAKNRSDRLFLKIVISLIIIVAVIYVGIHYISKFAQNFLSGDAALDAAAQLAHADELYRQGNPSGAIDYLGSLLNANEPAVASEALILAARCHESLGRQDEAVKKYEAAIALPPNAHQPVAQVAYARLLENTGRINDAVALYKKVCDSAPPEMRAPAWTGLGRQAETENKLFDARNLYQKAVQEAAWDSPEWNEALDALGTINVTLIFSSETLPESKTYAVKKGDSLTNIGIELNTTQGLLTRANGIQEDTVLRLGQPLKYTPKDFRMVIERSKCRLFLMDKDGIFKRYPVGLGMKGHETALGSYKIGNKQKDPTWHKPGAGPIPPGDPANELGTRWMPLVPDAEGLPTDLGIHGTIAPESIGGFTSHGCPRMLPADVEELYDLVVRSTPVEIVETFQNGKPPQPPSGNNSQGNG